MRNNFYRFAAGAAFAFILLASPGRAQAALAQNQVDAVLTLLAAFGADASVIQNVRATLTGSGASTGTSGSLQFTGSLAPGPEKISPGTKQVAFSSLSFFNNTTSAVTLYTLVIERSGSSGDSNLGTISILNNGVVIASAGSLDSRHQATLAFNNTTLQPGERITVGVYADISTKKSSNKTVQLNVVAINTSSPVLGGLPITGTKHTIR